MHAPAPTPPPLPRVAEFLGYVPVFQRLTAEERRVFAALVREQRVARGALIVRQGDPGDALYVVRAGQVKVTVIGEDGREVILGTLGATSHFGELALLDGRPRSAHVLAMEPTTLYVLRREDFRRQVEQMPRVAWALLEELSRRLREADQKITGLVLLDVPGRVARLLLDRATGEPPVVERAPTHETIAQMIGASRETVSRAMKELQDLGLIRTERRTVHLVDRDGLTRRASPGAATRAARAERAAAAERNEAADVGVGNAAAAADAGPYDTAAPDGPPADGEPLGGAAREGGPEDGSQDGAGPADGDDTSAR